MKPFRPELLSGPEWFRINESRARNQEPKQKIKNKLSSTYLPIQSLLFASFNGFLPTSLTIFLIPGS